MTNQLQITSGTINELETTEKLLLNTNVAYKWVVKSSFEYKFEDKSISVPVGFLSDGATMAPDCGSSWIFHDYLYAIHKFTSGQTCTRENADKLMHQILKNERLNLYSFFFDWASYFNPFYAFSSAWKSSGTRGVEFYKPFEKKSQ